MCIPEEVHPASTALIGHHYSSSIANLGKSQLAGYSLPNGSQCVGDNMPIHVSNFSLSAPEWMACNCDIPLTSRPQGHQQDGDCHIPGSPAGGILPAGDILPAGGTPPAGGSPARAEGPPRVGAVGTLPASAGGWPASEAPAETDTDSSGGEHGLGRHCRVH